MKLLEDKKERVVCPRTNKKVKTTECGHCSFLAILEPDGVKCRWTKEKEELQTGRRFYEI